MLVELRIQNIALIESLNLALGEGLHVLTGETGAGKSIIIDAVSLLLGGRASADLIRSGCDQAFVEGLFQCSPSSPVPDLLAGIGVSLAEDGTFLLSREVSRSGRSVSRVNGKTVPLGVYRDLGRLLVDIHGQHEHQSLSNPDNHLRLLDAYGGPEIVSLTGRVGELCNQINQVLKQRQRYGGSEAERSRQVEFLRFQIDEIDQARLQPGEEEQLREERMMLANAEKLLEAVGKAYLNLFGGEQQFSAYDRLSAAIQDLRGGVQYLPALQQLSETAAGLLYQIEDLARELESIRERLEVNPARLAEVEDRLQLIRRLQKKYGATIEEILRYREEKARELEELTESEARIEALDRELTGLREKLDRAAATLSEARQQVAARLEEAVCREIADLGMTGTRFQVEFKRKEVPTADGWDRVEFLLAANPGEPLKPLARIASGGELSRIMLALKTILASQDQIPTLIFDEVDAGIGGRSLVSVARKLSALSRFRQVICVTHSPQIAGYADRHMAITKLVKGGRTYTEVCLVTGEDCVLELARMLGGEESEGARDHAREILRVAAEEKNRDLNPV